MDILDSEYILLFINALIMAGGSSIIEKLMAKSGHRSLGRTLAVIFSVIYAAAAFLLFSCPLWTCTSALVINFVMMWNRSKKS